MNKEEFLKYTKEIRIIIDEETYKNLESYYEYLIKYNENVNLTAITKKKEVFLKHFYDSLTLIKAFDVNKISTLCDFGSGAGFPGLVLKICFPNLNITLIESQNKKATFLNKLIEELKLKNIKVLNERVEEYRKEKFDIVTCRAVSSIGIICEMCTNIVKINGYFIPMKGKILIEELKEEKLDDLGFKLKEIINLELPIEESKRSLVVLKKIKKQKNGFPRPYNKIKREPLF